jgi:DNA-binding transcriptional LysR family regulator
MSDTNENDIRRVDGGLLLVFRELVRRRRTTAVAAHLGLSQSAVSHALARLRDLYGDPLFLRRPHGLEPTPRAVELAPRIEALIDAIDASLRSDATFDPSRTERFFRIAATEHAGEAIAARLAPRLRAIAPRSRFAWQFTRGYVALEAVQRGQADVALGRFESVPAGMVGEPLFEDRYCVVARLGHPTIDGEIDAATWATAGHVFVSSYMAFDDVAGPTIGEDPMPNPDQVATVALVPRWEMALAMVAASDAIATGSRRVAENQAARYALQVIEPPQPAYTPWTVSMARRAGGDTALDWFCAEVCAAAAG